MTRPQINDYSDYRDFIQDSLAYIKNRNPKVYSNQYFARKTKSSRSYLLNVTKKRHHLGLEKITDVAKLLDLSETEKKCLTMQILSQTSEDAELRRYFRSSLSILRGQIFQKRFHDPEVGEESTELGGNECLNMTLLEMTRLPGFEASPSWIKGRLRGDEVSQEEIDLALKKLVQNGLLRNEDGQWVGRSVFATPEASNAESFSSIKSVFGRARQMLGDIVTYAPASFSAHSLAFDETSYDLAFEAFYRFRNEVIEISRRTRYPSLVALMGAGLFCAVRTTKHKAELEEEK